jgi:hypothetical protein
MSQTANTAGKSELDQWVARANITALRRKLFGEVVTDNRTELLRQLVEQEQMLNRLEEAEIHRS